MMQVRGNGGPALSGIKGLSGESEKICKMGQVRTREAERFRLYEVGPGAIVGS